MLEIPRLFLLIAILSIASYHDVRTRTIPDYVWIVGSVLGAILYIFDWSGVDLFVLFSILVGGGIALLIWKYFPMGDADALGIITVSVVYPVSFDSVMTPAVAFFGGLILEHIAAVFYNLRYNIEDLWRRTLFCGVENSVFVKIMAFYSVHKKRQHEKFTFRAETVQNGKRAITFKTPNADSEYETGTGVFVTWAMPALPFMMTALVIGSVSAFFIGFY